MREPVSDSSPLSFPCPYLELFPAHLPLCFPLSSKPILADPKRLLFISPYSSRELQTLGKFPHERVNPKNNRALG